MIGALIKSVKQLGDPRSRKILFLALGLAVLVFITLAWLTGLGISALPEFETSWINTLVGWMARLGFVMISWVIFPAVVSLFIGIFIDSIAEATERLHYPERSAGAPPPFLESIWAAMKYGATVVAANIAVLPIYLLVLWFPPAVAAIYYSLNGYLLSREFFELVAHRHMSWREARALRKTHQGRIFIAGLIIAFMFTMPLVNLVAAMVATAFMVHLFMGLTARREKPVFTSMRERLERNEL
ncbi:MAG: EI24 domain-containing protein [Sphingomonadales bacterium]